MASLEITGSSPGMQPGEHGQGSLNPQQAQEQSTNTSGPNGASKTGEDLESTTRTTAAIMRRSRKRSIPVKCPHLTKAGRPCAQIFLRPNELNKHVKLRHKKPGISCAAAKDTGCSVMFREERDMKRHVRSSHRMFSSLPENGLDQEPPQCAICGRIFARADTCTRHVRKQHATQK